jgi:hypothetical protein
LRKFTQVPTGWEKECEKWAKERVEKDAQVAVEMALLRDEIAGAKRLFDDAMASNAVLGARSTTQVPPFIRCII